MNFILKILKQVVIKKGYFACLYFCFLSIAILFVNSSSVHATSITQTYLANNSTANSVNLKHFSYANPNAPKAGILSLQAYGTFNSANPWMNTGVAMQGTNYLYDTLMTVSLDEAATMYPQLAEKVTFDSKDKSWVIYHLNPKARFWDNSQVTANDVKASFNALISKGPMWIRSYLVDLDSVEVLTKTQVKFLFKTNDNPDILMTVGQFPVFKKSSIEQNFEKISLTPLVGSGAYKIENVNAGRSVTYKRNPDYWGKELMVNKGRYNFDYIKYLYYMSDEIAFEGFKAGQYKFREEYKARRWVTAYNFPAVREGRIIKENIDNRNPVTMKALVMNQRRSLFQSLALRKALTYAFDFEWMNKTLFYGQYERLQSFFFNSELEAKGTPSESEMGVIQDLQTLIPSEQYASVIERWQLPKSDAKGYNRSALLQARKLLIDNGYYYKDMKLYLADGTQVKFEILLKSGSNAREVLPYIRNLKRLGISVGIREVDASQYIERKRNYDYDMIIDSFMQGSSPGGEQASYWGSKSAADSGNQNTAGIKNPAIDQLIERLAAADNREDIITYSKVLDRLLRAGYYMVPMYGSSKKRVAYWKGYKHTRLPSHAVGIDYWWWE